MSISLKQCYASCTTSTIAIITEHRPWSSTRKYTALRTSISFRR